MRGALVLRSLRGHWPEYAMEAAGLGAFMVSACVFATLLEHPASPAHTHLPNQIVRRVLMGIAMGATAIGIIYSPWGKRSGAHINPAVTLTFYRLGRIELGDAIGYACAQFLGGAAGVLTARLLLGNLVAHPSIHWVVTAPAGDTGIGVAAAGEAVISFVLMLTVLTVSGSVRYARFAGVWAGTLVATFIAVEAPLSGMSMNPARTAASALFAGDWSGWWVYFTVPPVAMLLAAETHVRLRGGARDACAKLCHARDVRCIFCGFCPVEPS
jgi:aquaporin Z